MENLFDAGGFLVCFPVWIIGQSGFGISAILRAVHSDGEIAVPVFTDKDLAQTFLENECPAPTEYSLISIEAPWAFLGLLIAAEHKGFTHVIFDPSGPSGTRAAPRRIADLRASALAWAIGE